MKNEDLVGLVLFMKMASPIFLSRKLIVKKEKSAYVVG